MPDRIEQLRQRLDNTDMGVTVKLLWEPTIGEAPPGTLTRVDVERLLNIAQAARVITAAKTYGDLCDQDIDDLRQALGALDTDADA